MTLDTYGHVIAELAGQAKPSRPAAELIAEARANVGARLAHANEA